MTENFIDAVLQTTEDGSWDEFINYFGSHYAYKVTFGGRYIYSHSYSAYSMSYFKSRTLDISVAAKVQFAMFFKLSMSDDLKRYQN